MMLLLLNKGVLDEDLRWISWSVGRIAKSVTSVK
jgi:hypothetical protein